MYIYMCVYICVYIYIYTALRTGPCLYLQQGKVKIITKIYTVN